MRVSKSQPCPVCKKPDWCRVFADGWVECMRVPSDKPAKSGGWMHCQGPSRSIPTLPPRFERAAPALNATKLMREWAAATPPVMLANYSGELGIGACWLAKVGAAWAEPHKAWAFPMCDGYGNVVGIRLRNERGKFAVRGSRQGIFLPDRLAPMSPWPCLYVCEGPTDTASGLELGMFAVGRPNCCCGGPEIKVFAKRHHVRRVVIISDNDKPGLDGARKVGAELELPFAIYVPPAKDLREFVQLGGSREMIENTLQGTVWQNG